MAVRRGVWDSRRAGFARARDPAKAARSPAYRRRCGCAGSSGDGLTTARLLYLYSSCRPRPRALFFFFHPSSEVARYSVSTPTPVPLLVPRNIGFAEQCVLPQDLRRCLRHWPKVSWNYSSPLMHAYCRVPYGPRCYFPSSPLSLYFLVFCQPACRQRPTLHLHQPRSCHPAIPS